MKKTINIIIFGLLILIFGSYMFTFQVRQDEVAFLSTGGSAGEPIETTGLKFKLPWPFQQLYVFDKRIRLETNDYEQMATKNDTAVVVQLFFGWKIKESGAREFFEAYKGTDDEEHLKTARKQIKAVVQEAGKEIIKDEVTNVGYFISNIDNQDNNQTQESKVPLKFEETEKIILENANKRVAGQGVEITFVGIRRVGLPQRNLDVVLAAMVTEWESKAATEKVKADSMAATIKTNALNERIAAINTAKIQAASQVSEAQEKAKKRFESFKKDPELAAFLMQLDALERSVKDQTTLILDETMGPFPILRGLKPYLKPSEKRAPVKPE
ncbi:MAG: SPFH domain-containing protein [Verrucomicrobiota bacterium]|jgi:membrane protease subunit HflC|nr:SPFH domain-containing protein [Verrucomicrobiota bacterium]